VDLADSLAYLNHDVDDGLRSDFIGLEELRGVRLWREVEADAAREIEGADPKVRVARMVSRLIDRQVRDLIEATAERLRRLGIDSVEKARGAGEDLVAFSAAMRESTAELAAFLNEKLYRHFRILKMAEKAKRFITEIFEEYLKNPGQLPPAFLAMVAEEGRERAICDYIAGMTDRFCQDEYKRLFYPFERM
jgi:dGTPase